MLSALLHCSVSSWDDPEVVQGQICHPSLLIFKICCVDNRLVLVKFGAVCKYEPCFKMSFSIFFYLVSFESFKVFSQAFTQSVSFSVN